MGLAREAAVLAFLWEAREAEVNLIISTGQCLLCILILVTLRGARMKM